MSQIQRNNPQIKRQDAIELANVFHAQAKKYRVPSNYLAAIAMQEGQYFPSAKNCYLKKHKVHCDYCMMQISDDTIERFGFDKDRLMTDLEYCVEAGAKVLSDIRHRHGKTEENWFSRYYSQKDEKRKIYEELVGRWM